MSEDWIAVALGSGVLLVSLALVFASLPADYFTAHQQVDAAADEVTPPTASNPLASWFAKPGSWVRNPLDSVYQTDDVSLLIGIAGVFVATSALFAFAVWTQGLSVTHFSRAYPFVFLLALLAFTITKQEFITKYNLEYALWALLVGLLISNTIGTPAWLRPAVRTELYIKTGLVLYGAKVLLGTLAKLGLPGLCVAWIVTPVVLITTFWFGQRVLGMNSKSLNMVISADMSVCGVSAAIATASACRAKQQELSLAIGLSLSFTVIMMIALPAAATALGLSEYVGGAWIGGTIDSTGAVVAAGQWLGQTAAEVAITIKLIQNLLIGVTAFGVALYWVRYVDAEAKSNVNAWEIWHRFPKFVIGFLGASALFSAIQAWVPGGESIVAATIKQGSDPLRSWMFCLAFVSIGLDTDYRVLASTFGSGKPLILYVCGQSLNLILTLAMAWLVFGYLWHAV